MRASDCDISPSPRRTRASPSPPCKHATESGQTFQRMCFLLHAFQRNPCVFTEGLYDIMKGKKKGGENIQENVDKCNNARRRAGGQQFVLVASSCTKCVVKCRRTSSGRGETLWKVSVWAEREKPSCLEGKQQTDCHRKKEKMTPQSFFSSSSFLQQQPVRGCE